MTRQEILAGAKPILFNTEMVRVILDNRKTVTRRVVKKKHVDDALNSSARIGNLDVSDDKFINCLCSAPYEKGDILYVRETWQIDSIDDKTNEMLINFKALQENYLCMQIDCKFSSERYKKFRKFYQKNGWQTPYSMPKKATRIFLSVTDVRVERLQGIDDIQLQKEGIPLSIINASGTMVMSAFEYLGAYKIFANLWNSTIKKTDLDTYGWQANPWVWVIEFERIKED